MMKSPLHDKSVALLAVAALTFGSLQAGATPDSEPNEEIASDKEFNWELLIHARHEEPAEERIKDPKTGLLVNTYELKGRYTGRQVGEIKIADQNIELTALPFTDQDAVGKDVRTVNIDHQTLVLDRSHDASEDQRPNDASANTAFLLKRYQHAFPITLLNQMSESHTARFANPLDRLDGKGSIRLARVRQRIVYIGERGNNTQWFWVVDRNILTSVCIWTAGPRVPAKLAEAVETRLSLDTLDDLGTMLNEYDSDTTSSEALWLFKCKLGSDKNEKY